MSCRVDVATRVEKFLASLRDRKLEQRLLALIRDLETQPRPGAAAGKSGVKPPHSKGMAPTVTDRRYKRGEVTECSHRVLCVRGGFLDCGLRAADFRAICLLMTLAVELIESEEGFAVRCPALPGCWSQGRTRSEALANIRQAIALWQEVAAEDEETALEAEGVKFSRELVTV